MEKKLTSFELKIIACISMFIDHFGAIFVYQLITTAMVISSVGFNPLLDWANQHLDMLIMIYEIMRMIGRIAFPIYCFLLVEGFNHTRSKLKYCLRLFLFALISEVAFDMAFNHSVFEIYYNNVFFTLLLGFIALICINKLERFYDYLKDKTKMPKLLFFGCILLAFGIILIIGDLADHVFASDYGFSGVLCVVFIYLFKKIPALGFTLGVLATFILNNSYLQVYGLFGLIFISLYNGNKGKSMKYFFYLFYPLHLLFIVLLTKLCGLY